MGLAGAAIATVTAQMVVACLALFYLIKTNREVFTLHNLAISAARLKTILRIGISPFGQTLIPSVIIVLTNWQCIRYEMCIRDRSWCIPPPKTASGPDGCGRFYRSGRSH